MPHPRAKLMLAVCGLAAVSAAAQPAGDNRIPRTDLRRVEQQHADQSVLDVASQRSPKDLRMPNDFSGVYAIPKDADSRYAGWFARMAGGITAVFPHSVYANTPNGPVPLVPPGTIYMIGGVPRNPAQATGAPGRSLLERVDTRVDATSALREGRLAPPDQAGRAASDDPLKPWQDATARIFTDADYRARRVAILMDSVTRL